MSERMNQVAETAVRLLTDPGVRGNLYDPDDKAAEALIKLICAVVRDELAKAAALAEKAVPGPTEWGPNPHCTGVDHRVDCPIGCF